MVTITFDDRVTDKGSGAVGLNRLLNPYRLQVCGVMPGLVSRVDTWSWAW